MSKDFTELSAKEMDTTNGGGVFDEAVRQAANEIKWKFSLVKPVLSFFNK